MTHSRIFRIFLKLPQGTPAGENSKTGVGCVKVAHKERGYALKPLGTPRETERVFVPPGEGPRQPVPMYALEAPPGHFSPPRSSATPWGRLDRAVLVFTKECHAVPLLGLRLLGGFRRAAMRLPLAASGCLRPRSDSGRATLWKERSWVEVVLRHYLVTLWLLRDRAVLLGSQGVAAAAGGQALWLRASWAAFCGGRVKVCSLRMVPPLARIMGRRWSQVAAVQVAFMSCCPFCHWVVVI